MNFIYAAFIVLQWSWGIVQNLVGLIIFLMNIRQRHSYYKGTIVTTWNNEEYCMGMGMFIFMSRQCADGPGKESFERLKIHEYGHTVQSVLLGPLYLIVIGIPSCLWARLPVFKQYRKNHNISYYSFYPEKWANYLGERVTGCKSMGQV